MKPPLVSIAALALLGVPAYSAPPAWWAALHGSYLTPQELAQVIIPQAPAVNAAPAAVPAAVALPASGISYLPKFYGSVGGGGTVPGKGRFAYESISAYLGQETYATTVQEFTLAKGAVQSCTMAGLSKPLYQFGFLTLGITGLGGGCSSTAGTSGAAGAAQGFASFHLARTGFSVVATGDKTFTTDGRQAVKLTLGVAYGK